MSIQLLPSTGYARTYDAHENAEMPSYTYALDFSSNHVRGFTDAQDAMAQAIFKHLQTWQYAHDIYSGNYGFEARGLVGKNRAYIESELKRRIKDALSIDTRIKEVKDFEFSGAPTERSSVGWSDGQSPDALAVSFTAITRFGDYRAQQVVRFLQ